MRRLVTVRVMLVTPAINAELRAAAFGADAPLDDAGRQTAGRAAEPLRAAIGAAAGTWPRVYAGASARCRETAEVLGFTATDAAELADWDVGRWRGRRLEELAEAEGDAVRQWLADPAAAPHGGESLAELCDRVGCWLAGSAKVLADGGGAAGVEGSEGRPEETAGRDAGDAGDGHGGRARDGAAAEGGAADRGAVRGAGGGGRVVAVVEPAVVRAAVVYALGLPPLAFWRLDVAPLTLTELSGRAGRWNLRCGRPLGLRP